MKRTVEITGPAKRDIADNRNWWAKNRSVEQANRWYDGVIDVMFALAASAEQHAYATEPELKADKIRQVAYGLGRRPSHRILYAVRDNLVVVYRVRAFKQDAIGINDLER